MLMKRSLAQRFSTAFAFVALAGILAFGGGIRYFCYCAGSVVVSLHGHCQGGHGDEGRVHQSHPGHHHEDHTEHDHEDHEDHHHEQVKNSTDLRLPDVVAAPEPKPISLFWTALCEWDKARLPVSVAEKPRLQIVEDPPPVSRQLARSVVRLI